jgi:outer membrane receptor for ferrienterochelin and colicins
MKFYIIVFTIFILSFNLFAQNSIKIKVMDEHSGNPLPGANVLLEGTTTGASANENGIAEVQNIPGGEQTLIVSMVGYNDQSVSITFPSDEKVIEVFLEEEAEELEEIYISSTRASRLISDEPVRVEVIAGEEIDEKISMEPSNISMMLSESTGIQVQQTSAVSANASFRIQGLDGRFTLLLKDGFPLYSGFSGSLSLMQIPPLDLKQIEIIKGSSSTLYGGGAISGLMNLITKDPALERKITFLLNGTSAAGLDLSSYYSEKFDNIGLTLLAARNSTKVYDNNNDNFSDIPETERYSVNPKIYFYLDESQTIEFGGAFSFEDRLGGDIKYISGDEISYLPYFEKNVSRRISTQAQYQNIFSNKNVLTLKNSFGFFNRSISLRNYRFNGKQLSSFSEISFLISSKNLEWIFGANLYSEKFTDERNIANRLSYSNLISGGFIQKRWEITEALVFENGFRGDYSNEFGFFPLPKTSLLIKWNDNLTSRIGGGLGYKIPSIFMEEAEELNFINILRPDYSTLKAEKSYGANFDINVMGIIADIFPVSINQMFFYTRINNPLLLNPNSNGRYTFVSSPYHLDSKGIETNIRFSYDHIKLFGGYSFTEVIYQTPAEKTILPLTPKHKLGLVLIYEKHDDFRIGLEGYYTGRQKLSGGQTTTDYWITGVMVEKKIANFSFFLNFENFLDTRQSRYGAMYTGSLSNPNFVELYAPTDGRIINGGVKISL